MNAKTQNWMFTINNPQVEDDPSLWDTNYLIFQLEKGAEGTEHYQGYCIFPAQKRLSAVKKINAKAHWEPRRGSHDQAVAYCSKEETRVSDPFISGVPPHQGKAATLLDMTTAIAAGSTMLEVADLDAPTYVRNYRGLAAYKMLKSKPRSEKTRVLVLWGTTGTGKSHRANEMFPNAYVKTDPNLWFDGYDGQKEVIFDDFTGGWLSFHYLLTLLDKYSCRVQIKGGYANWSPESIIITSNHPPHLWYPASDYAPLERRLEGIWKVLSKDEVEIVKTDVPLSPIIE